MTLPPPPPQLHELAAGARLVAGLGYATVLPDLDFETRSEAGYVWDEERQRWEGPPGASGNSKGLPVVGAEPYAAHPTCRVIWMSYDLKDGAGRRRWHPGEPPPYPLLAHVAAGGLLEAWNVGFERWIWKHHCVRMLGWPPVNDLQWRCAMAKARASGLPGSLDWAGRVMGLTVQKDKAGGDLMKKFSMPRNPTAGDKRRWVEPIYTPEQTLRETIRRVEEALLAKPAEGMRDRSLVSLVAKANAAALEDYNDTQRYGDYNETDIAAEAEASSKVPDLEGEELLWWQCHERINQRGVHIDRAGVEDCIAVIEQAFVQYHGELNEITGIDSASKVQQLLGWLHGQGAHLDSLDEEAVEAALKRTDWPPVVRRVLEIRAAVGSASVKKLYAIRNRLSADDRLRDLYIYYGARTGRSTGEGPQPTNLPKAGPDTIKCGCGKHYGLHAQACPFCRLPRSPVAKVVEWNPSVAEQALEAIRFRSLAWVEAVYGDALLTISGCLRALFDAAPGHDLISTDYNSIEAVGLAMVSGESWRIEVFRGDGKIYERSAAQAFRVPYEEFAEHKKVTGQHHPLRQKGKGLELACLAPEVLVLTRRGYVQLADVQTEDQLWDGVEWVSHKGVVAKGHRQVIDLGGARMTPDHRVLCGRFWKQASQLASNANTLSRALETGSANLPFSPPSGRVIDSASSSLAPAVPPRTPCYSATSSSAKRLAAIDALNSKPAKPFRSTSGSPILSRRIENAVDSWAASLLLLADAITKATRGMQVMALAASEFTQSGAQTNASSSSTSSPCLGGTTPGSTWTGSTSTATTNPETCDSSHGPRTPRTSAKSTSCPPASMSWSDVFDIAHAGPRNRFTILTSEGHLIVHNCGYQGWLGAAQAFGIPGSDEEIKKDILAWRAASPAVEWLWGGQTVGKAAGVYINATAADYKGGVDDRLAPTLRGQDRWDRDEFYFGVEGKAIWAVLHPGEWWDVARLDGTDSGVAFKALNGKLYCRLPNERVLTYNNVQLMKSDRGEWALSYEGWNSNPKNGPKGWIRINTWGGRLVENIIQAVCRDVLRACCICLELAGYPVVLHTYDEPVSEVPEGFGSVEEYERVVTEEVIKRCPWAADWPIRAPGGYRAKRYRKG